MPAGIARNHEARVAKFRQSIRARQAQGLRFGRTLVFSFRRKTCVVCGKGFQFKYYPNARPRRVCSKPCASKAAREARRKIPEDFSILYDLYWNQNLSTPAIARHFGSGSHKAVRIKMLRLGIPLRKAGRRRQTSCIIQGCSSPVFSIVHPINKSHYGRRCLLHWVAHRKQLAKDYWVKIARWRSMGITVNARGETDINAIIQDVVPKTLPYEIREEVCQEVALQLLTHKTHYSKIRETVQRLTKQFFKEYQNKYGDLSLDAPMGEDGLTLGEMLDDRGRIRRAA